MPLNASWENVGQINRLVKPIIMRPTLPSTFEDLISKPRLRSYKSYFKTQSIDEAIGLYMWNCELSTCFSALLSFFEVALRNNIHRTMSQFRSRGTSNSYHWYDGSNGIIGSLDSSIASQIDDVRHEGYGSKRKLRNPAPTPDEIVSRVSFGFWPGVLSAVKPWELPNVFPFHPLNCNRSNWNDNKKRTVALAPIYEIKDFRNRVAHHEPLWKFSAAEDRTNNSIVKLPASNNLADSLNRFKRFLSLFDGTMKSMNEDFHYDLVKSGWRQKLDYLLSDRGIARYRTLKYCPSYNPLTPAEFHQEFSLIVSENQPVHVEYSDMKGLFTPE